jgi:aminocarboxymuconate-semialdehyde decarboxylase
MMLGSDHPYPWEQHPVDSIFAATSLSDRDRAAIFSGNAARVLGIKA